MFTKHWYFDSLLFLYGRLLGILRKLERKFAIKINIHFIFQPLYQERSIMGYVLGFLFRSLRITVGVLLYFLIIILFAMIYFMWFFIPIFVLLKIFYVK